MRRFLLSSFIRAASSVVLLGFTGCFYAPTIADCAVACTNTCPAGLRCLEGLCRTSDKVSCECQSGTNRVCGTTRGECKAGTQTCAAGSWGSCVGEITPTREVCDGFDNDCDGLTDQFDPVVLYDAPVRDWRWLSLDSGFALVTMETTDAGDDATTVHRYGPAFEPLEVTVARVGPRAVTEATGIHSTVYLGWALDGGLQLAAVTDGQRTALEGLDDAGVGLRMRMAVNDERLLLHWDRRGSPSTRLGRWTTSGQLTDVTDFSTLDAGYPLTDGFTSVLSSKGHYAVFTATSPPDAGLESNLRLLIDTATLQLRRINAPYYQYDINDSHLVELRNGALASVYTYIYPADSWSGLYMNPDMLTLTTADEVTVEEVKTNALAWGGSDAVADAFDRVSFVYMDNVARRLVLARSVGSGRQSQAPVKRPFTSADGFGVPRLGTPDSDGFLPLAWYDQSRITARRVCPVR